MRIALQEVMIIFWKLIVNVLTLASYVLASLSYSLGFFSYLLLNILFFNSVSPIISMILRIFKSIRLFSYKIAFPSQLNNNGQYNFTDKHTRVQSSENKKSFSNAELSRVEEKELQKIVDIDKIIR